MFSNTAYEALYQYIGLALHTKFIDLITSQKIFLAALMMVFGVVFFMTTVRFFARYLPGALVRRRSVPLSRYFRLVLSLFIGISLLQVGSSTSLKQFDGESWNTNPYIESQLGSQDSDIRVSFIFDLLSRSAEEVARLLSRTVDTIFESEHSQLDAPNFFFKAILYAGSATIDDPNVTSGVDFYTTECLDRIIPLMPETERLGLLDALFGNPNPVDTKLEEITVTTAEGNAYTCLDVKQEVRDRLTTYARSKTNYLGYINAQQGKGSILRGDEIENLAASQILVNHFYDTREDILGIQKGSQPPTGAGRLFQRLSRIFSWDSILALFTEGGSRNFGATLAAERADEFSANLMRAPHIAGAIKMVLIFVFPWLIFLLAGGYWKVLVYWFLIYFSVLLWTPLWTLFYHITVNIAVSAEQLEHFGKISEGISLYSAELILHRMNYLFSVFSWIQLLVGFLLSGSMLFFIRPLLSDTENDHAPEFVGDSTKVAQMGAKATGIL